MRKHVASEQTFLGDIFFIAEDDSVHRITHLSLTTEKFIKVCMADRTCEAGESFNLLFTDDISQV